MKSPWLQRLPIVSAVATVVAISFLLYALSTPSGIKINTLPPQGVILVISSCAIFVCLYTTLLAPCSIRRFGYAIRPEAQIRRMNLLGLVSFTAGSCLLLNTTQFDILLAFTTALLGICLYITLSFKK